MHRGFCYILSGTTPHEWSIQICKRRMLEDAVFVIQDYFLWLKRRAGIFCWSFCAFLFLPVVRMYHMCQKCAFTMRNVVAFTWCAMRSPVAWLGTCQASSVMRFRRTTCYVLRTVYYFLLRLKMPKDAKVEHDNNADMRTDYHMIIVFAL